VAGTVSGSSWLQADPKESILKREGDGQMYWTDYLLDVLLVLSVATVLGTGVTLSYFLVKWVVRELGW
jgi:hypothetical protein